MAFLISGLDWFCVSLVSNFLILAEMSSSQDLPLSWVAGDVEVVLPGTDVVLLLIYVLLGDTVLLKSCLLGGGWLNVKVDSGCRGLKAGEVWYRYLTGLG